MQLRSLRVFVDIGAAEDDAEGSVGGCTVKIKNKEPTTLQQGRTMQGVESKDDVDSVMREE